MCDRTPDKLPYAPDKFVNRETGVELVLKKARRLAAYLSVEWRVIIFHGQRGSGKTWLLLELKRQLDDIGVASVYIDLSAVWHEAGESVGFALYDVTAELGGIGRRPFVLLLDNVNEASESLLDELEERVLAPLAQEDKVLIVLAERGQPHYWTAPVLRECMDKFDLQPFERPHIEEQVEKQIPDTIATIDQIEALGGGYPWSTYILARHLPQPTALALCVGLFLRDVDQDLLPYFEALSVLKAFDETRMAPLLQVYSKFADQDWDYGACRKVRERLVDTRLARWDADARGYVIDEALRLMLDAGLRERDFEIWASLHCAACRLYEEWADKYEQSREWWTEEKQYHAKCLEQVGRSLEDCREVPTSEEE